MSDSESASDYYEDEFYEEGEYPDYFGSGPAGDPETVITHYDGGGEYTDSESESDVEEERRRVLRKQMKKRKKRPSCPVQPHYTDSESESDREEMMIPGPPDNNMTMPEDEDDEEEGSIYAKVGEDSTPRKKKKKKKKSPQKTVAELSKKKGMELSIGEFVGCRYRKKKKRRGMYEFSYVFPVKETMKSMGEGSNASVSISQATLLNLSLDHMMLKEMHPCDHVPKFHIVGCPKLEYMYSEFPCPVGFNFSHMRGKQLWFGSTPIHGIIPPNANWVAKDNDTCTPLYIGHDINSNKDEHSNFFASLDPKKIEGLFKPSKRTEDKKVLIFEYDSPIGEQIRNFVLKNDYGGFKKGFSSKSETGGAADEDYKRIGMDLGDATLFKEKLYSDIRKAKRHIKETITINFHKLCCKTKRVVKWGADENMVDDTELCLYVQFELKIKFV